MADQPSPAAFQEINYEDIKFEQVSLDLLLVRLSSVQEDLKPPALLFR